MTLDDKASGPHQGQPVLYGGATIERARGAVIMVHGRGADAHNILGLAAELDEPQFLFAAPQANGDEWYPNHFASPLEKNEPELSSALRVLDDLVKSFSAQALPPEQIVLLGFSQGACLALEYAARNARRFGAVIGLSGAIIGPADMARKHEGSLEGTPVFLGCSETDPYIPADRVRATAEILGSLGAEVTLRLYPEPGHSVNDDELRATKRILQSVASDSSNA